MIHRPNLNSSGCTERLKNYTACRRRGGEHISIYTQVHKSYKSNNLDIGGDFIYFIQSHGFIQFHGHCFSPQYSTWTKATDGSSKCIYIEKLMFFPTHPESSPSRFKANKKNFFFTILLLKKNYWMNIYILRIHQQFLLPLNEYFYIFWHRHKYSY